MLSKKELAKIRRRFEEGGADKPLCIEGDHIKDEGQVISLGWNVKSAKGHGMPFGDGQEAAVVYATGTTWDGANFLVHLPVDMGNLLRDAEQFHLLLAGLLAQDEEATRIAKAIVIDRVALEREARTASGPGDGQSWTASGPGEPSK